MGIDPSRGFVAFPRGLTEWEWYTEPNTARLFFHLLLTANWQEKQWQGITIHPGELVTSQSQLAKQLGLSVMQVRTALEHLRITGYITVKAGPKYSVVTINHYDTIVMDNKQSNRLITGRQQADNNNLTIITTQPANKSSSGIPSDESRQTTAPVVQEFEAKICRLNATGRAELMCYTERLGEALVSAILTKCADLGGHSWAYVRKALTEAEAQGCTSAEEYRRTNPIGGSRARSTRVDRATPSGNDFLNNTSIEQSLKRLKKSTAKEGTPHVPES